MFFSPKKHLFTLINVFEEQMLIHSPLLSNSMLMSMKNFFEKDFNDDHRLRFDDKRLIRIVSSNEKRIDLQPICASLSLFFSLFSLSFDMCRYSSSDNFISLFSFLSFLFPFFISHFSFES